MCAAGTPATNLAAQAQSTQATVYWSSSDSVMVIEKPTNAFVTGDYPTSGLTWNNNTAIGPNGAFVRYVGAATTSTPRSGLANDTTYYYQVFPYTGSFAGTCYAPAAAAAATARPSSSAQEAWSYMLAGGAALRSPIAGADGIYFGSNAKRMISLSASTGLQSWAPATTTSSPQGWLVPVPLSAGGSRVFAGDQGGKVYSLDTSTGTTPGGWAPPTLTGATAIQSAASVQLRASSTGLPGSGYDLVMFATKNGAATTNNKVFGLRSDTGAIVWTFNDGGLNNNWSVGEISGMPALDYGRNRLYVTSVSTSGTGASLWIVDTTTGLLVSPPASCPTANSSCVNLGDIDASPALSYIDNATLLVSNTAGKVYAIDLPNAPGANMMKWTAPLDLGATNQVKGVIWEDWSIPGRLYMVVANTTAANNTVRCFKDPGVGQTPNASTACSNPNWSGPTVTVHSAQAAMLLDKLYVTAWDTATSKWVIQQIDVSNGGSGGAKVPIGDGASQPGDVSTDVGNELFVMTTEGKVFKITLPLP